MSWSRILDREYVRRWRLYIKLQKQKEENDNESNKMRKDFKFKTYKDTEKILDKPLILTLNTLRGKNALALDSHWVKIPNRMLDELGIRIRSPSMSDFRIILQRKDSLKEDKKL